MKEKQKIYQSLFYPILLVMLIWIVEIIQLEIGERFTEFGLYPRNLTGLRGIFLSPFLHSDYNHLINNSIPLLIMGTSLFYFYRKVALRVLFMIVVIGGLWTWISARPSFHIGASGLVYGLFGFLLISGFLRRNKSLMSISFLVAFIYGSMVWGILPIDYKISWEGHLWGLLSGIAMAYYYRREGPQSDTYKWEEEDDLEENAEEIGDLDESDGEFTDSSTGTTNSSDGSVNIIYHYRKKSDDN